MEGIEMANENLKKFLDSAGVGHLWGKVTDKIAEDVKVESDRAQLAEKALNDKIGDLGDSATVVAYVDKATADIASNETVSKLSQDVATIKGDYVKSADIANFETKENVKVVSDDLAAYKTANDAAVLSVKNTADAAATKEYVDAELAKKANQTALDSTDANLAALKARVEAFLDNTGAATEAIDTLQELINYTQTHDDVEMADLVADIQAINNKLAGIDGTVKAYVDGAVEALNIGDYAKAADLVALAGRVTAVEGKVDVEKVSTAISDAKAAAVTEATGAAKSYTDTEIGKERERIDALVAINHDAYKEADTALQTLLEGKIATAKGEAIAKAEELNAAMDTRVKAVEAVKHTHANKTVLDGIDETDIAKWDAAQANAEATAKAYTDEQFALIRALSTDEIDAAIAG
jgi:acylphosphatase